MAGQESCCLCSSAVSQGTWKIKRRKVAGESSKLTMKVLDTLSKRLYCRNFSCCIKDITSAYFCHKCRSLAEGLATLMEKMKSTEKLLIPMIVKLFESIDSGLAMERKRKTCDHVLATKCRRISGEVIDEIQRENILLEKEGDKEVMQLMEEEGELFHREETQSLEEGEREVILVVEGEGEPLHREESQLEEEEGEREVMPLVEGEGELLNREESQAMQYEEREEEILQREEIPLIEDREVLSDKDDSEPSVSVKIKWPSKERNHIIHTPWRRKCIKQLTRKNFRSFSGTVLSSSQTSDLIIKQLASRLRSEMKEISSENHSFILRDSHDGIRFFKWDRLFCELSTMMPTLIKLLLALVCDKSNTKRIILVCFIASILLKKRLGKMALLQRAVSVLLYGNGCTKQVYNCLQPLMVCLSHSGTLRLIDQLSQEHDIKVQEWSDSLRNTLKQHQVDQFGSPSNILLLSEYDDDEECDCRNLEMSNNEEDQEDLIDNVVDETNDMRTMAKVIHNLDIDDCVDDILLQEAVPVADVSNDCHDEVIIDDGSVQNVDQMDNESEEWHGFKIVGDNLDKNFRRSFQRVDSQTVSQHYFHMYAVKDRVDMSNLSESPRDGAIDIAKLLPLETDHDQMTKEFSILISRFLVQNMKRFENDKKEVVWHIDHKYAAEMKMKSTIVPLGIEFKNENKIDEMSHIMDNLHKYVPTVQIFHKTSLPNGDTFEFNDTNMWKTLFGGDQLTVARARTAAYVRDDHDIASDKLHGLVPVIEDWHARMTFLKVIWKHLYTTQSASDKGTLFQLRNILHRTSVPSNPQENMNAVEDFLEVVLVGHVIAAAEKVYMEGMTVNEVSEMIVNRFVKLRPNENTKSQDSINVYACELLTLSLIWFNFYDGIKEGDGERVIRIWKYLMVIFRKNGNRNYAKEAAALLISCNFTSSERVATQTITSRFVNTKGRAGCNLPCDLHMEHLNRRLKGIISKMESNVHRSSIERAAKAIGLVDEICRSFGDEMMTHKSDKHKKPSYEKDLNLILDVLRENDVFSVIADRKHKFVAVQQCLLESINNDNVTDWIIDNIIPLFI